MKDRGTQNNIESIFDLVTIDPFFIVLGPSVHCPPLCAVWCRYVGVLVYNLITQQQRRRTKYLFVFERRYTSV